jgi:MYXO-CTERM domain-containing protein
MNVEDGGCGCRQAGDRGSSTPLAGLAFAALALALGRRRRPR